MKTKTNYKNEFSIFDRIQYFISIAIPILFFLGLIPTYYNNVFNTIIILLSIQLIISLFRFRLLNLFIELILIGLSVISLIPLLGYIFRFLGIIFAILDMASFKSTIIYTKFENMTFKTNKQKNQTKKSNKTKSKFESKNIKDADFEEK